MTRNQLHSPLLRLPGEIRNKIYVYTFSNMYIRIYRWSKYTYERFTALISTCSQLRYEARAIFFDHVTYRVSDTDHSWIKRISRLPVYQLMTYIRMHYSGVDELRKMERPVFPALKRVYVSASPMGSHMSNYIPDKLRACTRNQDLEVIFEKAG